MAEYYVISPTGEKYGPASVDLLNQWAAQSRVLPNTVLEEAETGQRYAASQIIEISVPPPMPASYPRGEPYQKIESHMVKAIIATVLCCVPLGIAGIVYASQVDGHLRRGDMAAARNAANKASMWANWSIGLGIVSILFYVIISVATGEFGK
jgi:hypothetical protein